MTPPRPLPSPFSFPSLLLLPLLLAPSSAFSPRPPAPFPAAPRRATRLFSASTAVPPTPLPHYVVVGAGWGGWGAAKSLAQSGRCSVTLLDVLPDPTGATPYLSATGKPVEAGWRGFWRDYPNLCDLVDELGLSESAVFTEWTESTLYSPAGEEVTAPVFSAAELDLGGVVPPLPLASLPSPLGQVFATFPAFRRLPVVDRASVAGILLAAVDCLGGDESVQESYDRMTGHELCVRCGLTERLVEDFVRPFILVCLFAPLEELSALVVLELIYFFAAAHHDSFDVRWMRKGSVAGTIVAPLAHTLREDHGLEILGGSAVEQITLDDLPDGTRAIGSLTYRDTSTGARTTRTDVDGIVLALGSRGLRSVVSASPDLAAVPEFSAAASLPGIDVMSVRLWLDGTVATRSPSNVLAGFDGLRGAGGTYFLLDQLQDDAAALWGDDDRRGSVVAADLYGAGALLSLPDEEIVRLLAEELLPGAEPAFGQVSVVDSWIGRYPGAVTWFSPGSYSRRPPTEGAGAAVVPGIKFAGDWVRMGAREHGAKGLCQERAYVSGIEAGNALLRGAAATAEDGEACAHPVLPVREDEAPFRAAVAVNNAAMRFLPRFWVR